MTKNNHTYIGLGSNVQRRQNISAALEKLARVAGIEVVKHSPVYKSFAVNGVDAFYCNQVICIESALATSCLKDQLKLIEGQLRRQRGGSAVTIDLDILARVDAGEADPVLFRDALQPYYRCPLGDVAPEIISYAQRLANISMTTDELSSLQVPSPDIS